jgi:hypothetical protein
MNSDKILDYIGWTLIIVTIILLRFSERLIDNIINSNSFLIEYLIYGVIISSLFLYFLFKINRDYFKGNEKRASAVLSYFFGVIGIFLFSSAYLNFQSSKKNQEKIIGIVVNKSNNIKYKTNYVKLIIDKKEERFISNDKDWKTITENDTLILTVGHGFLGYKHILSF